MAANPVIQNMAVFCDFENVALGVREANYPAFDIGKVLERLLLKGSIVVKKAYCDWDRYKEFKKPMHEAAFELIEIPHVRQSGKNSADIRMVVDALDLCYTKAHLDCFVIVSGDSDFSPLVSKLRENDKLVIGVGVRKSTSDLLTANCDEFIFYDDLVKEELANEQKRRQRQQKLDEQRSKEAVPPPKAEVQKPARASPKKAAPVPAPVVAEPKATPVADEDDAKRLQGIQRVVEVIEAMMAERGSGDRLVAGEIKNTIKRRSPEFSEAAYGFNRFEKLLEAAAARGLLATSRDEKTGNLFVRLP
jgi:uncharacterized LabA/DUF88 family protein